MQRVDRFLERVPQQRRTVPWQAVVRQRLHGLDAALAADDAVASDSWLAARAAHLVLERERLRGRLAALRLALEESTDQAGVRADLERLIDDVRHHHQRITDLAYDALGRDVGGSG